jgi:stage II sporulation protein AA (anti-sigma F factor antagonist)
MQYRAKEDGNGKEVFLSGSFKFTDNNVFREIINDIEDFGGNDYVLDLDGLEYIDSAGLGMLLIAREMAEKNSLQLRLRRPQGQVQQMLQVTKFIDLIPCEA